jgi:acyl carrier protein
VAAIEQQIIHRLAENLGCDVEELERELRFADHDLPVDEGDLKAILGLLEDDFAVALPSADATRLSYVRALAMLIDTTLIRGQMSQRAVLAERTA